ncbi:E1 ubiquitin-activating protein aos1 [Coemansia thaxteri]|uniref:Ubiquitin-like 1-activating enzyme E1A n=1 Tax=Coemansia thaxteri TaxID=2663907 RepID=A0A9W8BBB8_9FUNG|nr:E1 ubiquitin-activating protein aos1 [Coemansia thaxteri]KAJ2002862.1 E1 ubiquitin-activating protein aos1 [Coemansia thaxteri]KAJ2466416.1 E1 ubiquitin-activating protein aos1 [Coemansia sp. RSA 2322]KAJ2479073.1 E1 ubiquitin-activating protein aos1 [Coemansia sp. RSA 2320]
MSSNNKVISKEEEALYDRQIRLWGMEAQNRLRNSSILFIGVNTLTLEACKNLVLGGVGSLSIYDPQPISSMDLETHYYFNESNKGQPKDQVLVERLGVLNPLVTIRSIASLDEVKYVDLVVNVGRQHRAMDEWRQKGTKSILADAFGLFGYIFVDCLDEHGFIEESRVENTKTSEMEMVRESKVASYKSFTESVKATVPSGNAQRLARKYSPLVFVCQALASMGELGAEGEQQTVGRVVRDSLRQRSLPAGFVADELIDRVLTSWGTEFVPSAAVVGGTLAQEVLKIITLKDMPANNWFVYDGLAGEGITCTL